MHDYDAAAHQGRLRCNVPHVAIVVLGLIGNRSIAIGKYADVIGSTYSFIKHLLLASRLHGAPAVNW